MSEVTLEDCAFDCERAIDLINLHYARYDDEAELCARKAALARAADQVVEAARRIEPRRDEEGSYWIDGKWELNQAIAAYDAISNGEGPCTPTT